MSNPTTFFNPPETCDLCGTDLAEVGTFYDIRVYHGPRTVWANVCPMCRVVYAVYPTKLGAGIGQEYTLDSETGNWIKTGG